MFFLLSKSLSFLLSPSNILIGLGLVGAVLLLTRRKGVGLWMVVVSFILLAIAGWWPTGNLLTHALESRFPLWDASRGPPDGVIVLGGGINSRLSREFDEPVLGGDGGRTSAMTKLARAYPGARIVYTGGDAGLLGNEAPETDFVMQLVDSLGVPRERVLLESRSRNTAENAAFTKELVKPGPGERWLLVTSAQHMPRAIGCFRKIGFPVEAYPAAWRTGPHAGLGSPSAFGDALARFDSAVYEWIGLVVYWATGKTSELFPSP